MPGILWLSHRGLTQKVTPPLFPLPDPDLSDQVYGDLHCSTEAPHDKNHMELLAKLVNDRQDAGILHEFEKRCA